MKLKKCGATTSNLLRHIRSVHKKTSQAKELQQPSILQHVNKGKYGVSSIKKKELDLALVKFIAGDLRPIAIVEGKWFIKFIAKLDPRYQLPSRKSICRKLGTLVEEEKDSLRELLAATESVAVTADGWRSRTTIKFVAITVHFMDQKGYLTPRLLNCSSFHVRSTGENIKDRMKEVFNEYNISSKIVVAVTDDGSDIKCAVGLVGLTRHACFGHVLNTIVGWVLAAVPAIKLLRDKVSEVVTFVNRSANAWEDLMDCQRKLNMKVKRLAQDVDTRWNSLYLMLTRFLELRNAITLFIDTCESVKDKDWKFDREDWKNLEILEALFEPMYMATVQMSQEYYVSGSMVIPMTKNLLTTYSKLDREHRQKNPGAIQEQITSNMVRQLSSRLGLVGQVRHFALATICDPRDDV